MIGKNRITAQNNKRSGLSGRRLSACRPRLLYVCYNGVYFGRVSASGLGRRRFFCVFEGKRPNMIEEGIF